MARHFTVVSLLTSPFSTPPSTDHLLTISRRGLAARPSGPNPQLNRMPDSHLIVTRTTFYKPPQTSPLDKSPQTSHFYNRIPQYLLLVTTYQPSQCYIRQPFTASTTIRLETHRQYSLHKRWLLKKTQKSYSLDVVIRVASSTPFILVLLKVRKLLPTYLHKWGLLLSHRL